MPLNLSIITINLDNINGLQRTIHSVLCQTYRNYEFLIIDGGSSDGSRDLLSSYGDKINYWISETDRGIYHAMNKGIRQSSGKYCLFLNSGDWLVDQYVLARCFEYEQTADLLLGDCNVSKNDKLIFVAKPKVELSLRTFYGGTIPHQSTFIKRSLFTQLGEYDETLKIHGDYEFWIRSVILHYCSIVVLNVVVTDYNLDGLSSRPDYQNQSRNEINNILQNIFPKRVLKDYEYWKAVEEEMQIFQWARTKKMLNGVILLIYNLAVGFVRLKRAFTFVKARGGDV